MEEKVLKEMSKKIGGLFWETFFEKSFFESNYPKELLSNIRQSNLKIQAKKFERIFCILKTKVKTEERSLMPLRTKNSRLLSTFKISCYEEKNIQQYVFKSIYSLLRNFQLFERFFTFLMFDSEDIKTIDSKKFFASISYIFMEYNYKLKLINNQYYSIINLNFSIINIEKADNLIYYHKLIQALELHDYSNIITLARSCQEDFFNKKAEEITQTVNTRKGIKNNFNIIKNYLKDTNENLYDTHEYFFEIVGKILEINSQIRQKFSTAHPHNNTVTKSMAYLTINSIFSSIFYIEDLLKEFDSNQRQFEGK